MSSSPGSVRHPLHPQTLVAVAVGGALGSLLRWSVETVLVPEPGAGGWPWATMMVNVLGSAALAWLVVHDDHAAHAWWLRPGLGTGLLGGFTTFSTYAVQVAVLGTVAPVTSLLYLLSTVLLCVGAAALAGGAALRRVRG